MRFDILFKIINPKLSTEKIRVNLHIDMEAQKSYRPSNPSYPILKRAVYYAVSYTHLRVSSIKSSLYNSRFAIGVFVWWEMSAIKVLILSFSAAEASYRNVAQEKDKIKTLIAEDVYKRQSVVCVIVLN